MSDIDISPEAVEQLAHHGDIGGDALRFAPTLRALSAALTQSRAEMAKLLAMNDAGYDTVTYRAVAAAEARGRRTGIATEKLERLVNWLKEDEDNVFLLPAGDIEKMRAILAAIPQGEKK